MVRPKTKKNEYICDDCGKVTPFWDIEECSVYFHPLVGLSIWACSECRSKKRIAEFAGMTIMHC